MSCNRCGRASSSSVAFARTAGGFRSLSRAAGKYARARWRESGHLVVAPDWRRRLEACRECSLRVIVDGESYCGRPIWQRGAEPEAGCGCPITAKARDPLEHCPLVGSDEKMGDCGCRWCVGGGATESGAG